jgi:hypothetical protein
VVDLPTPPFWFAIAMILADPGVSGGLGTDPFADLRRRGAPVELPFEGERPEVVREAAFAPEVVTAGS